MTSEDYTTQSEYNKAFCKIMKCKQQYDIPREQLIRTIVSMNAGVTDIIKRFYLVDPNNEYFANFSDQEREFLRGEA